MTSAIFTGHEFLDCRKFWRIGQMSFGQTIAEIAAAAVERQISTVWLIPTPWLAARMDAGDFWVDDPSLKITRSAAQQENALVYRDTKVVCRIQRADDPRWGFEHTGDFVTVCDTITTLTDCLGMEPMLSPTTTGIAMLRRELRSRGWLTASCWDETPAPALTTLDVAFLRRDLDAHDWHYIHLLDRNAAYLNAARSSDFGLGMPVEPSPSDCWSAFGLYTIRIVGPVAPEIRHLVPMPLNVSCTVAYPVVSLLAELGIVFVRERVLIWPHTHRLLQPWCRYIEAGRNSDNTDVRTASKRIANQTIGMFTRAREQPRQEFWYRPEWRAHIVATNTLTFTRAIREVDRSPDTQVIAAYIDMVAVASKYPEPPAFLTMKMSSVGGYKRVATIAGQSVRQLVSLAADPETRLLQWIEAANAY